MRFNLPAIQLHSIFQLFLTLAASLFTLRVGAGLAAWRTANQLEKPNYTVVRRLPIVPPSGRGRDIEVRKYEPYLIAETTTDESSMRKAGAVGFGRCAGYIFGKNQPRSQQRRILGGNNGDESEKMAMTAPVRMVGETGEKMAMTAPVRASGSEKSGKTKVSFVIGSKYTLQTVPKPVDPNVQIRQVKGHYLAARTFSGPPPSDERVREERKILERTLEKEGIRISNKETMVYGYHDPVITPNMLRKNEVAVMVDEKSIKN